MSNLYQFNHYRFHLGSSRRVTYAVQRLILATAAVFAAQLVFVLLFGRQAWAGYASQLLFDWDWFARGRLWQPISYMFLHGSLSHLFWNMLQLYIFGPTVERKLGTRGFLSFYLTCGAVGVLATGLTPWLASISPGFRESLGLSPGAPAVAGASGAVLATLVAFAMADPDQELYLIPIPIPLKARALVILIVALNLLNALGPGNRTSVATHFGGMAAGYAYIKLLPHLRKLGRSRPKDKARKGGNVEELEARRRPRSPEDALRDAVDEIFRSPDDRDRGR